MSSANLLGSKVYGEVHSVYLFFLAVLLLSLAHPGISRSEDLDRFYRDDLLREARDRRLAREKYWEILMHYKPRGAGLVSFVDDPKYFLASDGKTNPQTELEALIEGLFLDNGAGDEHPRCRFPARYEWLKEKLSIDEARLPPVTCAEFTAMYANINPQASALVFPAAHGNGPASMFGHTLLKIDGTNRSGLLSYAITYAADANDTNGFVYAYKGIFGYYKGYFSLRPYYEKVSEYNDIEYRDIWEYQLNLTKEETRRMVLHVWELKDIYADYYFFDRNCSFDLLFLLEAARPSVRLTDAFSGGVRFWVIPSDTVRVIQQNGLIEKVAYRPSQATRILALSSRMDEAGRNAALAVANRKHLPEAVAEMDAPPEEKKNILDLTAELLQYRYSTRQLEKEEYLKRFLPALRVRSTLGGPAGEAEAAATPVPPEQGHLPGKISPGLGYEADAPYAEIAWRAAYHDLLDPDDGFVEGAAINFFDLSARYYPREERLDLQRAHVIDILSLAARDVFFKPVSWKVLTGFDREIMPDGGQALLYRVNPGGGLAYKNSLGYVYFMVESDVELSDRFKDRFAIGLGPSAGLLTTLTNCWKLSLRAQGLFYELGEKHRSFKASLSQNFKVSANNSIRLSLSRQETFDRYQSDLTLSWNLFL